MESSLQLFPSFALVLALILALALVFALRALFCITPLSSSASRRPFVRGHNGLTIVWSSFDNEMQISSLVVVPALATGLRLPVSAPTSRVGRVMTRPRMRACHGLINRMFTAPRR